MSAHDAEPPRTPPRTTFEWLLEALAFAGLVGAAALVVYHWPRLPDRMPAHFDVLGRPDAWTDKGVVALLPLVSIVPWSTLSLLALAPGTFDLPFDVPRERLGEKRRLGREMLSVLKAVLTWTVAWITWRMIRVGTGEGDGLGVAFVPVLMSAVVATVLIYRRRLARLEES